MHKLQERVNSCALFANKDMSARNRYNPGNNLSMTDLQEYVQFNVRELSGARADDAWHALVETGPVALPHIITAYDTVRDLSVKLSLITVVCQYSVIEVTPFLARLLQNNEAEIWKSALDGLVKLGGDPVLEILRAAEAAASPEKRNWIEEAVQQIIESHDRP